MTWTPPTSVYDALKGSSDLAALATGGIYQATVPEDKTRPYVVWTVISNLPENTLSCPPEIDDQRVQIDCWAPIDAAGGNGLRICKEMMQSVVQALTDVGLIVFGPWQSFDTDTRMYRWSCDIEVWNPR